MSGTRGSVFPPCAAAATGPPATSSRSCLALSRRRRCSAASASAASTCACRSAALALPALLGLPPFTAVARFYRAKERRVRQRRKALFSGRESLPFVAVLCCLMGERRSFPGRESLFVAVLPEFAGRGRWASAPASPPAPPPPPAEQRRRLRAEKPDTFVRGAAV